MVKTLGGGSGNLTFHSAWAKDKSRNQLSGTPASGCLPPFCGCVGVAVRIPPCGFGKTASHGSPLGRTECPLSDCLDMWCPFSVSLNVNQNARTLGRPGQDMPEALRNRNQSTAEEGQLGRAEAKPGLWCPHTLW